ncbi:hypothetical protein [Dactylosporangium sp. CA-139066]|uniref:hypothetical protein n=1 Tax=Dactylosporangium sp. CA-139066 TaxID=3239930 RepID=UPI003D91FCBA
MIENWNPVEPTDGRPRTDRHGVTWTPRDGVWWGFIGHTGEDGEPYEDFRQWRELSQRGPFEVGP